MKGILINVYNICNLRALLNNIAWTFIHVNKDRSIPFVMVTYYSIVLSYHKLFNLFNDVWVVLNLMLLRTVLWYTSWAKSLPILWLLSKSMVAGLYRNHILYIPITKLPSRKVILINSSINCAWECNYPTSSPAHGYLVIYNYLIGKWPVV